MYLKRFMLAIASVAMLAAVMASSASAAAETHGTWHVEGVSPFTGPESVSCSVGTHEGEKILRLTGFVGTTKIPVTLKATGIDCVESTIFNSGGAAKDAGKLRFTGVTVEGELGTVCSVEGGTVETKPLLSELYRDSSEPSIAFDKFEPEVAGGNFAVVPLVGASCPIAGKRPAKGFVYGQATNPTGFQSVTQPLTFSPTVDATAGSSLEFAGNEAHLDGQVVNVLSGVNTGKKFWAE